MSGSLTVHVFKGSHDQFCEPLRENNVDFTERWPPPGMIVAAGEVVEILYATAAASHRSRRS